MKKIRILLAMLALALVFGFAFVSCGGGGAAAPKTIEGLFDELKGFNVGNLYAYTYGSNASIDWCATDNTWEPWDNNTGLVHGGTPAFGLADAYIIYGEATVNANSSRFADAREIIKKLDGFFGEGYKIDTTVQYNYYPSAPAGTTYDLWYYFSLRRNGVGIYGSSVVPSTAPFMADYYSF